MRHDIETPGNNRPNPAQNAPPAAVLLASFIGTASGSIWPWSS